MPLSSDLSNCERCAQQHLCHGAAAGGQLPGHRIRIVRNAPLYLAGDEVGNRLYNIRSGSFKLVQALPHCGVQVIGFGLPPEFLGLDALGTTRHACSAIALEDSEVCRISWDRYAFNGRRQPMRQAALHALLAAQIRGQQRAMLMLQNTRAEQRMADLVLSLSRRHRASGYSPTRFRLPMSRCDLASYVGVTAECMSRLIAQFRRRSLFELCRRDLILLDPAALERAAAGGEA
jgi:CRP/FNR family transcriptional regulator